MAKYHIYKLGLALIFYMIYSGKKSVVNCLKVDDIGVLHTTDYRERRDAGDYRRVDGTPNVDFPTYSHVPKTKFSCRDMEAGYYADLETDCQVFHICDEGRKLSFLCPNGTVFQQGELICDWWFKVNCTSAPLLYEESAEILQRENAKRKSYRRINQGTKQGVFSRREDYDTSAENPKQSSPVTTEAVPTKYTSRADRKLDLLRNEVSTSNRIQTHYNIVTTSKTVERTYHKTSRPDRFLKEREQFKYNASPTQNPPKEVLKELGIVIGPNHNLPLKINDDTSDNRLRVSSYGNVVNSGEMQEVQETASFVTNSRNRLQTGSKTYPNHRESYSEIKDPRQYNYQQSHSKLPEKPFYGSSVSPQVLSTVPVSPNYGIYPTTTEPIRPTIEGRFSYSFKTDVPFQNRIVNKFTTGPTVDLTSTFTSATPEDTKQTSTPSPNILSLNHDEKVEKPVNLSEGFKSCNSTGKSTPNVISTTTESSTAVYLENETTTKETRAATTTVTERNDETIPTSTSTVAPALSILQPKPFSVTNHLESSKNPPYELSSASPFIINVKQDALELSAPIPTQPTLFTSPPAINPIEENIHNMIATLMNVLHQHHDVKSADFGTPRPGLVIPPSAGPQTLHTLAIYFANVLENATANATESTAAGYHEDIIKDLLTQMTRNNYDNLFGKTTEPSTTTTTEIDESENDLLKDNTNNLVPDVTNVRVLARVFTEALSAYLEDPETFKKVLHEVRPTEPPLLRNETTEADEDEVLNYSDSDLKSDHPYLHIRTTENPVSPTWGYILAFNKTSNEVVDDTRNSLSENENLQSADSQSFISQLNKISEEFKTTTASVIEANALNAPLPNNHWTDSKDVAKLWQNALSINPADLNQNFDAIADDVDTSVSAEEISSEVPAREIHYDLRSLPKLELNSTQVHGILIDFMHTNNRTQGAEKLQRLLHKLNISEDEFLEKMQEIEGNPFTRRLILLLISECSSDNKQHVEARALSANDDVESETADAVAASTETNIFKSVVQPTLADDDEDTRALQLLNSLYVIASKFGK